MWNEKNACIIITKSKEFHVHRARLSFPLAVRSNYSFLYLYHMPKQFATEGCPCFSSNNSLISSKILFAHCKTQTKMSSMLDLTQPAAIIWTQSQQLH